MSHQDPTFPPLLTLAASIVVLAAAPMLHRAARWSPIAMRALGFGVAAATVLLVVIEILPECADEIGVSAYAAAVVGLVGSIAFERRLSAAAHRVAPWIVAAALGVHALTDGLAIAGGCHEHGHALGFAVVMHRLPVGLAIWFLLRPRGLAVAVAALAIEGGGTIVGYVLGDTIAPFVDGTLAWMFQALVAGVLLHVVMHVRGGR